METTRKAQRNNTKVRLNLESKCARTVRLFIGHEPNTGGEVRLIVANSVQRISLAQGETVWLMDRSKALASLTLFGSQDLRINRACNGFVKNTR